jgi:hypothetical protein
MAGDTTAEAQAAPRSALQLVLVALLLSFGGALFLWAVAGAHA